MKKYRVGFIFSRSFVQKEIRFPSATVKPLSPTGFAGVIHDVKKKLESVHFNFTRRDLENTLRNYASTGHCMLVEFEAVEGDCFVQVIESKESEAENIAGALSVINANPATLLCAFAEAPENSGIKFYIPYDRVIRHGTNFPGYYNALLGIEQKAQSDTKFSLLLRLFRASLRETEIDNQILFQLILFDEASENETGSTFAVRLRNFSERIGFAGDLALLASECGVQLPEGRDVIDLLVKLRNSAAHNGNISEDSLRKFNGDWVVPVVHDKQKLHKLITEAVRYMFCCLVGHTRDHKAVKITGSFVIQFD